MVASGLDRQANEVKTSVLLHSIGTDALDVYNTFPVVVKKMTKRSPNLTGL